MTANRRWRTIRPHQAKAKRKLGLNENYARELMELHTLGVDGGYTQQDIIEVARCLHWLDHFETQTGRRIQVREDSARRWREDGAGTQDRSWRRHP